MRKTILGVFMLLVLLVPAMPVYAGEPETFKGEFESVWRRKGQPHRVYFQISSPRDAEYCEVRLSGKTVLVPMDIDDDVSGITHLYFTHTRVAKKALAKGQAAIGSPTWHVKCVDES